MDLGQKPPPPEEPRPTCPPSHWRGLHQLVLRETDLKTLLPLVYQLEDCMVQRWQELARRMNFETERTELQSAAEDLFRIKIERLGWPDPFGGHREARGFRASP